MKIQVELLLVREARKKGGDRYEGILPKGSELTLYIPQEVSRNDNGVCRQKMKVTFES